jgi:Flp pilus assembly protein CpaB
VAIVVALVVAVASVVGLFFLVQAQTKSNGTGSYVGVWVTTDQLVAGATISTNDVQVVQRDPGTLPTNYMDSGKVVVGQTMVVAAAPGTVLTQTTVTAAQLPALSIPNDWVAMAIPDNPQLGVAGYVQSGDHIDIVADASQYSSNPKFGLSNNLTVRYVLQDVTVLKAAAAGSSASGFLVVALPRAQAEELAYLDAFKPASPILTYVLRNQAQSSKIDPHTGAPGPQVYLSSGSVAPNNPATATLMFSVSGQASTATAAVKAATDAQTRLHDALNKANLPGGSFTDGRVNLDIYSASGSAASTDIAIATITVDATDPTASATAIDIARKSGAVIGYAPGNYSDEQITSQQLSCLFPASGPASSTC